MASNLADSNLLKITRVETVVVNAEMRNWIFVKVYTSEDGLYGWGEASLNWKTNAPSTPFATRREWL